MDVNDGTATLWCAVETDDYFGNVQVFCAMPKNSVINTINWVEY